ncbi:13016_t:CDS:2 [Entrophospora sp. SA101]|nr:13016_t:CDS:2 [Entrophospora sp. SA101]
MNSVLYVPDKPRDEEDNVMQKEEEKESDNLDDIDSNEKWGNDDDSGWENNTTPQNSPGVGSITEISSNVISSTAVVISYTAINFCVFTEFMAEIVKTSSFSWLKGKAITDKWMDTLAKT